MIIAIDGPAGAGKSTVARRVADELGLTFLDTGAMYRALTLVILNRGIHPADGDQCGVVAREVDLRFDDQGEILIDGLPGEPDVRSATVTLNVSAVSAHPSVRTAIVEEQRNIAERLNGIVAEGRDTTTIVFPHADHKFFLSASAEKRARRRARQTNSSRSHEQILADIERRDRLDTTRAYSPLAKADDAVEIDVGSRNVDEVVAVILAQLRESGGAG